jgi:hypothetical protein
MARLSALKIADFMALIEQAEASSPKQDHGFERQNVAQDRLSRIAHFDGKLPPNATGENVSGQFREGQSGLLLDRIQVAELEAHVVLDQRPVVSRVEKIAGHAPETNRPTASCYGCWNSD